MEVNKKKNIIIRCTAFEKKAIEIKAKNVGLTVSEYCRRTALNRALPKVLTAEELEPYLMLKKYQTDFARIANLFKKQDPNFYTEVRELTQQIDQELKKLQNGK